MAEKEVELVLPNGCLGLGCQKRGMDAVNCPLQLLVGQETFEQLPCSDPAVSSDLTRNISGGQFVEGLASDKGWAVHIPRNFPRRSRGRSGGAL